MRGIHRGWSIAALLVAAQLSGCAQEIEAPSGLSLDVAAACAGAAGDNDICDTDMDHRGILTLDAKELALMTQHQSVCAELFFDCYGASTSASDSASESPCEKDLSLCLQADNALELRPSCEQSHRCAGKAEGGTYRERVGAYTACVSNASKSSTSAPSSS